MKTERSVKNCWLLLNTKVFLDLKALYEERNYYYLLST